MDSSSNDLTALNRAIDLQLDDSWALAHRGELYRGQQQYQSALADLDRAIELEPNYAWALAHRGVTYRFMGRQYYDRALADLNRAIELKPNYAWAFAYRGFLYELMGRYEDALADFDRTIALDASLFGPYWRGERSLLLSYNGRYDEALESCRQALLVHPEDFFARYGVAILLSFRDGPAGAQAEIQTARTALQARLKSGLQPEEILYWLAVLAILEGQADQALDHLRAAIALAGDEVMAMADRDPAWRAWRDDPRFGPLVTLPDAEDR